MLKNLAAFLFICGIASAGPVAYDISFGGPGLNPTSGSFVYDADVPQFSNFFVDWNGVTFDLTASTNSFSPGACGGSSGASAAFSILSGSGNGGFCGNVEWYGETTETGAYFRFYIFEGTSPFRSGFVNEHIVTGTYTPRFDSGPFSVSSAVPEPSTLLLVGASAAALALRRRLVRTA